MKRLITILFAVALGLNLSAQDECLNPDVNCDGYVNVNDLLGLLGYFGDEDLDGDGIWDSQDDCVEDGCGICGGPGPQVLAVDTITFSMDSTFIEVINEWYVFEIPDTTFTFVCVNPGCTDPTAENFDPYASEDDGTCIGGDPCGNQLTEIFGGYDYDLVAIGDQCWFAENLRTEFYQNGDSIPGDLSNEEWAGAEEGAQAVSNDESFNLSDYGRLYNGYAVNDYRGLCPSDWRVPSEVDYVVLTDFLGGNLIAGSKLKSSSSDSPSWNGTNISGFSGLAGGNRTQFGDFLHLGSFGFFWTSTIAAGNGFYFGLSNGDHTFENDLEQYQQSANSVRCVRD